MMRLVKDYYSGYEGYPEITFVRRSGKGEIGFKMWMGFFEDIIETIRPSATGWTDLALYYHTDTGWYDDPEWSIPDSAAALRQLESVDESALSSEKKTILKDLLAFLRSGVLSGEEIVIRYS